MFEGDTTVVPLIRPEKRIKRSLVNDDNKIEVITTHLPTSKHHEIGDVSTTLYFINRTNSLLISLSNNFTRSYNWDYIALSNGGFYISPEKPNILHIETPNFIGQVTNDCGGIVVCLLAYRSLEDKLSSRAMQNNYNLLRDYAMQHKEARKVLKML